MTNEDFTSPSGAKRNWLRWGCLTILAAAVAIAVLITVKIVEFMRNADPARLREIQVEQIKHDLQSHADDGVLTNEEIMRITSRDSDGDPKVRHEKDRISFDTAVHVVANSLFGATGSTTCYTFTVAEPLSRSSTVTATKLSSCDSLTSDK